MIIGTFSNVRIPPNQDEINFARRALREAVLCLGCIRLASVMCFVVIYVLVHICSRGRMSSILKIMLLVMIPAQVFHGMLLILGALEERLLVIEVALWICLILASYTTTLGLVGGVHFMQTGYLTLHFILACLFGFMAMSLYIVLCHDVLIIFAYKKYLKTGQVPSNVDTGMLTTVVTTI